MPAYFGLIEFTVCRSILKLTSFSGEHKGLKNKIRGNHREKQTIRGSSTIGNKKGYWRGEVIGGMV